MMVGGYLKGLLAMVNDRKARRVIGGGKEGDLGRKKGRKVLCWQGWM